MADIALSDFNCPITNDEPEGQKSMGGLRFLQSVREFERETGRVIPFAFASGADSTDILKEMKKAKLSPLPADHFAQKILSYDKVKDILATLAREFKEQPKPAEELVPAPAFVECVA